MGCRGYWRALAMVVWAIDAGPVVLLPLLPRP